jgi:hypothetical protein
VTSHSRRCLSSRMQSFVYFVCLYNSSTLLLRLERGQEMSGSKSQILRATVEEIRSVAEGCSERYYTDYIPPCGSEKHTVRKVPRKCPLVLLVKINSSKRQGNKVNSKEVVKVCLFWGGRGVERTSFC